MNNYLLGLIGGGQLGRMLLKPAAELGLNVKVFDREAQSPCKPYVSDFRAGNLMSADEVFAFGKDCSHVTIEFEHISADGLQRLADAGVKVYPQPEILKTIQDKGLQKEFYAKNGFPTAPYRLINDPKELNSIPFTYPYILKSRTQGYDGHGVMKMHDASFIEKAFRGPSVAEKQVEIAKEISVIAARNSAGEIRVYDPVELVSADKKNILDELISPAVLTPEQKTRCVNLAIEVTKAFGIVGLLAVEMFIDISGEVLVNEVAPRPHNSGHQTIECSVTSQYEQHLRAVLGLPLGDTTTHTPSIMLNILGEPNFSGKPVYSGLNEILAMPGVHVHLYGKAETRPFRKMGHVTISGTDPIALRKMADRVKSTLRVTA